MPIYRIKTDGEEAERLVKAVSSAAAIAHCAKAKFAATLVSKVEDAADLLASGVKLETAGDPPAGTPAGDPPASDTPPNDDPPEEARKRAARGEKAE